MNHSSYWTIFFLSASLQRVSPRAAGSLSHISLFYCWKWINSEALSQLFILSPFCGPGPTVTLEKREAKQTRNVSSPVPANFNEWPKRTFQWWSQLECNSITDGKIFSRCFWSNALIDNLLMILREPKKCCKVWEFAGKSPASRMWYWWDKQLC